MQQPSAASEAKPSESVHGGNAKAAVPGASTASGLTGAAQAEIDKQLKRKADVDRAITTGGIHAGPVAEIKKEYSVQGSEVLDTRRGLVFSRCAYGQKWGDKICVGKANELTKRDIFNPQTKALLGAWRVPSVDEIGAAMAYFKAQPDSPFKHNMMYWTSTRAPKGKGYDLILYAPKRAMGSQKTSTVLANSEDEQHAVLILVRKAAP
jgi:hypothetical protein